MVSTWMVTALAAAHFVSPLVKVRPGTPPPATRGELSLARGECEGLQLWLPPGSAPTRIEVQALRGPQKARLPVSTYEEAWIPVHQASNAMGATGLWADPLLPLTPKRALRSSAKSPAVVYLELCAPSGLAPGTYRGKVLLHREGGTAKLPLTATVQPFTLPATSSLPNTFGISLYSIAKGHGLDPETPQARALLASYVRELLQHRVSAHGMGMAPPLVRFEGGKPQVDFKAWDAELAAFLDGTALPSGARFTTLQVLDTREAKTDEERTAYLRAVREHLARRGYGGELFFYAKDEPKPADHPLVLAQARAVRGARGVNLLVTSAFHPTLAPVADILAPPLNCFFPRAGPQTCPAPMTAAQLRKKLGPRQRVYWYQSCLAHGCNGGPAADAKIERVYSGWASYMVDHPAPLNRAMGPLAWLAGVDGELYFDTVYAYNQQDPWRGVWAFGGNGDGTFFYPGTPARLGGSAHAPVSSLRLKHLRDGLEDYEYLRLLAERGETARARQLASKLAPSGYEISTDPRRWVEVRAELTRRLAKRPARGE